MIKTPTFITNRRDLGIFLLLVALFAVLFIIIYKPLGVVNTMSFMGISSLLLYTSLVVSVGFVTLGLSRLFLYRISRKRDITLLFCILWIVGEVVCLTSILTFLAFQLNTNPNREIPQIFLRILLDIIGILAIPTCILTLIFIIKEQEQELATLQEEVIQIQNLPSKSDHTITDSGAQLLNFNDSAGKFIFSVATDDLMYVESADNYVNIHYMNEDHLESHILHNTMKSLEAYKDLGLLRCHRYFMMNINKVKLVKRDGQGLKVQLQGCDTEIPVSKTYLQSFFDHLQGNKTKTE